MDQNYFRNSKLSMEDCTFYPTPETRRSNLRRRPIGIGVQGFADVLCELRHPFDSALKRMTTIISSTHLPRGPMTYVLCFCRPATNRVLACVDW